MKTLIEKLAIGNVDYEVPKAKVSHNSFDIVLAKGEVAYGSFNIQSESNINIKGIVNSSDYHLKLKNDQFLGRDNTIRFEANTEHLYPGDEVEGKIDIMSNAGGFTVTFKIRVKEENIMSSQGKITNLKEFTKLVQYNHEEAIKLFMSKEFKHQIIDKDVYTSSLYRELMKNVNKEIAMEEFLVRMGLKQPVTISILNNEMIYEDLKEAYADILKISKSGWGYVNIKVEIKGDILHNCKNEITLDNFVGNVCEYEYLINSFKLHKGLNCAEIILNTIHQTLSYKILVKNPTDDVTDYIENKRDTVLVMRNYMNFRAGLIDSPTWKKETEKIADKRLKRNHEDVLALMIKSQLSILAGDDDKIINYLFQLSNQVAVDKTNKVEEYCYYLYLKTIHKKNATYTEEVRKEIKNYYDNGYDSWKLLWMLMYMDDRYDQNPSLKYTLVKDQFNKGCYSPVMFYEAAKVIMKQPELLRVINRFEMQLLVFAVKYNLYDDALVKQIVDLFNKEKTFDKVKFDILTKIYHKKESVDVLEGICQMLVSSDKRDKSYFVWYDLGVKKDIKVTNLYEYYIYAIDTNKMDKLYPQVYKYFAFSTDTLAYNKSFLFENIINNFTNNSEMYSKYKNDIEQFIRKEVIAREIDDHLINIYGKMLNKDFIDEAMSNSIPCILNAWRIKVSNEKITDVIIFHKEIHTPQQVHLVNGEAFVEIYTANPVILFVDKDRNRYTNIEYTCEKLFDKDDLLDYDNASVYMKLSMVEKCLSKPSENIGMVDKLKEMVGADGITSAYRRFLLKGIVSYYYSKFDCGNFDDYIMDINMNELDKNSRIKIISILVSKGLFKNAYPYIVEYGYEGLSDAIIEKFCTGYIKEIEFGRDELVLELCSKLFRKNKINKVIIAYLGKFFHNTTEEMYQLYDIFNTKNIIDNTLTERLLVQSIFEQDTSERIHEIFKKYVENPSYSVIRKAFYTYVSYNYFIKNIKCEDSTWEIMEQDVEDGMDITNISKIAFLARMVEVNSLSERQILISQKLMNQLAKKNIVFEFYKHFNRWFAIPYSIIDKTIIDYRTNPKHKVYITYKIKSVTGETKEKTEEMRSVFSGIFTKDVIMFFGEEIEYFFEEIWESGSVETKKQVHKITQKDIYNEEGRFGMLNGMMICKSLNRDRDAREIMETYELNTDASEKLFKLL